MDAWQKGGIFEGERATDEMVLAFWKEKAAGVDKDDPMYDTYMNAHEQLDYTIQESKMTAGYALQKYSDAQMASFYLGWAKKVPRDSEFYRALQRDAGQYMRRVRAQGEAGDRRRKEEAYQLAQANTQRQMEAAGEYIIDTLRRIAQSGNPRQGIAPTISASGSGSDLTDLDPNDPGVMMRLIATIAPPKREGPVGSKRAIDMPEIIAGVGEFAGNPEALYFDDDGQPVTGVDVMRQLASLDPSFRPGQSFDVSYVTTMLDRQMQGLNERIERAMEAGRKTDVASLQRSKSYVAILNRSVASYPIQRAYQEARTDYDTVVADRSSSPQAVLKAWDEYSATLTHLANDVRIQADDNLRSRLIAEVNGDAGVPTLQESFTGLAGGQFDAASVNDAAENRANIEFLRMQVEAVQAGQAVWAYGELDSNGIFHPRAGGRRIGAATLDAVTAGGANPQIITVQDPLGGAPLRVAVTAVPVHATARNPETGEPLAASNGQPIAWAYDIPKGTGTTTQYGFHTKEGFIFSSDPNWDDRIRPIASSKGGNHLQIDFTEEIVRAMGYAERDPITGLYGVKPALDADVSLPGGLHVRETGRVNATTGEPLPGIIVFDPQMLAWSTDTRNALGSTDPITDFKSLTLSLLMLDDDGRSILRNLDRNPAFREQLDSDAYSYAGYQRDPKTGAWVPGASADPNRLANALAQQGRAVGAKTLEDFIADTVRGWERTTTGSPFPGLDIPGRGGSVGPDFTPGGFKKLASDRVRGTPFEALGRAFMPGTTNFRSPDLSERGFEIKPSSVIKAPVLPDQFKPTAQKTLGPIGGPNEVRPIQTGSQAPISTVQQTGSLPQTGWLSQTGALPPRLRLGPTRL